MNIKVYKGNPIIMESETEKHQELVDRIKQTEPKLDAIWIMPGKLVIRNIRQRSFTYPKSPTVNWIISRVEYMVKNNL